MINVERERERERKHKYSSELTKSILCEVEPTKGKHRATTRRKEEGRKEAGRKKDDRFCC
jgi:hypothetical protein